MNRAGALPPRELGAVGLVLAAVGIGAYGFHVLHGGFLSDAWANLAGYEFAPGGGFVDLLSFYLDAPNISVRPLQAVYLAALFEAFGANTRLWLGWQLATNLLMVLLLYVLLRRLSLRAFDSAIIAILVLLFPAASSLRFWTPTIWAPLSISMVIGGFLLALSAFESEKRRRRVALHAGSLSLFVASLLLYEVTLLVMLASVLLYRLKVPWKRAARRWAADCLVLVPIVLTVTLSSSGHAETTEGMWRHGQVIFEQAWLLLAIVVLPLGSARWHVLFLLGLLPLASILLCMRLPVSSPAKTELKRWLLTMAGGFMTVGLGYAIFIPGTDYYGPIGAGIADRVNAIPSIGWALVVYSAAMLAGTMAFRGLPNGKRLSSAFAALACGLALTGWMKVVAESSDLYVRAHSENARVLATLRRVIPRPPPESTIWTFGQPVEVAPGIPVFGNTWDMTSSVKVIYGDPTVNSYVGFPGTQFECGRKKITPTGNGNYLSSGSSGQFASRYGRTYFIDTTSGRSVLIRNSRGCRDAAAQFHRSPMLAGEPPPLPGQSSPGG